MNDTKEKILFAASKLFLKGGTSALSVRSIAREANVSTIGIYSYFQGKQGILDALYIEGFEMVLAATQVPDGITDPKEGAMYAARGYINTAFEFQGHYRLIFGESDTGYQPSAEAKKAGENAFLNIMKVVSHLLPINVSASQQQEAAMQVWSLVHGYVCLKHHAIADVIDASKWEGLILNAVSLHIDAMQNQYRSEGNSKTNG